MNPITKALQDLRYTVPQQILEKAFIANTAPYNIVPISLDTIIREKVIEARVMVDCNLMGGTEVNIPLNAVERTQVDNFTFVYRVPKAMTQGRSITRALSVSYGQGNIVGYTAMGFNGTSPMLDAASGLLNSHLPITNVSSAYCQLIGENVVMIVDTIAMPADVYLRCWIENDINFNHLQPTSYMEFSKLVEYAVKSYIYMKMTVLMDQAQIHAGFELGQFKNIIDGFSDAEANYRTQLDTWGTVAILNDFNAKRRHIQLLTGGAW